MKAQNLLICLLVFAVAIWFIDHSVKNEWPGSKIKTQEAPLEITPPPSSPQSDIPSPPEICDEDMDELDIFFDEFLRGFFPELRQPDCLPAPPPPIIDEPQWREPIRTDFSVIAQNRSDRPCCRVGAFFILES